VRFLVTNQQSPTCSCVTVPDLENLMDPKLLSFAFLNFLPLHVYRLVDRKVSLNIHLLWPVCLSSCRLKKYRRWIIHRQRFIVIVRSFEAFLTLTSFDITFLKNILELFLWRVCLLLIFFQICKVVHDNRTKLSSIQNQ
jgi:hypothetical protein